MTSRNEFIIETINFVLDGDMTIMYKKVFLKKYINNYLNDNNKDIIKNIVKEKNNDIYEYLFLSRTEKSSYNKKLEKQKIYNEEHKEQIKQFKKKYYQEHREEQINKSKENYKKKKELINKNINDDK